MVEDVAIYRKFEHKLGIREKRGTVDRALVSGVWISDWEHNTHVNGRLKTADHHIW